MRVIRPGEKGPRKKKPPERPVQPSHEPPQPPEPSNYSVPSYQPSPSPPPDYRPFYPFSLRSFLWESVEIAVGIVFVTSVVLGIPYLFDANYRYHLQKGKDRPYAGFFHTLSDGQMEWSRYFAKKYASFWDMAPPLHLQPDHVMLCLPVAMDKELADPKAGSPEFQFREHLLKITKVIGRVRTKPNMPYYQNKDHDALSANWGGEGMIYVRPEALESYRKGKRRIPILSQQYKRGRRNIICGETEGHEEGAGRYFAFLVTHKGDFIPWIGRESLYDRFAYFDDLRAPTPFDEYMEKRGLSRTGLHAAPEKPAE